MAKNRIFEKSDRISLPVAEGVKSGELVIVGTLAGVAEIDRREDGEATVNLEGAWGIAVTGPVTVGQALTATLTAGRVTAVAAGAAVDANYVGAALKAVGNGQTTTIPVRLKGS